MLSPGGYFAQSLAIMTDAAHLLTDFASMMISLFSLWMSSRPATKTMNFGWHRAGKSAANIWEGISELWTRLGDAVGGTDDMQCYITSFTGFLHRDFGSSGVGAVYLGGDWCLGLLSRAAPALRRL